MTKRLITILICAAAAVVPAACNFCGAEEERAINVSSVDSLTVTFGSQATRWQFGSRVGRQEIQTTSFDPVFRALEDGSSTPTRAIVVSASAFESAANQIAIALALPEDLTRGDVYTVNGTFTIEPRLSTDAALFGTLPLQGANNAQMALTRWAYTFPPAAFTVTYRASTATGTIRVTQRSGGYAELELNIQVTDPTNGPASLAGRVQVTTERHTPPCLS